MKTLREIGSLIALSVASAAVGCGADDAPGGSGSSGGSGGSNGGSVAAAGAGTGGAGAPNGGSAPTTAGNSSSGSSAAGGSVSGSSGSGGSGGASGSAGATMGDAGMGGDDASAGAGGEDAGEPTIDFDCSQIPALPADFDVISGVEPSEDFVFDPQGRLLNFSSESRALMAFKLGDTKSKYLRPGPSEEESISGMGMLPGGDVVVNLSSTVARFTADGGSTEIANSLEYPNGLTVARDGSVYVAEQDGGRVVRIDPDTKQKTTIAEDLEFANGVSLTQDQKTLHVGTFGKGIVYALDLSTTPAGVRVLAEDFATGGEAAGLDGVATDYCGNVYVTEFVEAKVWRITPDGQTSLAVDLGKEAGAVWIPNLHFGSGIDGWDTKTLYVMNLDEPRVFAVKIGVPGASQPQFGGKN